MLSIWLLSNESRTFKKLRHKCTEGCMEEVKIQKVIKEQTFTINPANLLIYIYRVSQEEGTKLRESVPYVKIYRYNPKHLYPKLNGYGDNGQRSLKL